MIRNDREITRRNKPRRTKAQRLAMQINAISPHERYFIAVAKAHKIYVETASKALRPFIEAISRMFL